MSRENAEAVKRVFGETLEKPADQRAAYLDAACLGDEALRARVEALLAAHENAGGLLWAPTHDGADMPAGLSPVASDAETLESEQPGEGPGTTIGRYKLLQSIGEGGFGVVYMAEQQEPVRRKVALKIIKLGMDTKQVIARFEAERQALAMMDHPNIARVFDAGATETGRSYFVMELVKGIPITEYCDKNNLSTKDRLDLFMPVCHAIQHAHQKGIIHRDIKPSNVMVTLHDGKPVPKVIDFGIAKATDHRLTEKTLFTEYHQFVGTPAYMSPEQAEMSGLDIDTRTDIYSLGVLLYELLTGTTPFEAEMLRQAAYGEIQRIIREVEPHKPSTRVSSLQLETSAPGGSGSDPSEPGVRRGGTGQAGRVGTAHQDENSVGTVPDNAQRVLGDAHPTPSTPRLRSGLGSAADIARHRRTDPSSLSRQLRGDLDWIVMKALEKDRTRRYETAKEFANDVEHHLASEPILAGRPGIANKLRKFIKRNRVAVTAGSLVAVAIVLGLIVSTIGFVQASRQRDRALLAEQEQSRERQRAEAARGEAELARTSEAEQRKLAESERDRAKEKEQLALVAEQEARRQAYVANIAAAGAALSTNEITAARRHLEAAPAELRGWEWRHLDAQSDDSLAVLRGHEKAPNCVVFSPDGTRLASASNDHTVRLWDVSTGKELGVMRGHRKPVNCVAFSPDGSRLASGSGWGGPDDDYSVRLWDVATGEERAILIGHTGPVLSVAFSPDGTRLASGTGWGGSDDDHNVRLWDVTTGEELAVLRKHEDAVTAVAFSPDGTRLASASGDKTVRIWHAESGRELAVLRGHDEWVSSVAFGPEGNRLASASGDRTIRIWDPASGEQLAVFQGHSWDVSSVTFSPDGTRLASASSDRTVRIWDTSSGEELALLRGHARYVYSVAFSPDGTRLASASRDKTVRIWDAGTGEKLAVLRKDTLEFGRLAFSPDGTRLAVASRGNTIRIWDPATAEELAILRGHSEWISSIAFSPDGTRLASASGGEGGENTVRQWDASTGKQLAVLQGHQRHVRFVAFSPDGARLVSGSLDKVLRIWDASTGEQLAVLQWHESHEGDEDKVWALAYSPDGTRLASGHDSGTVHLWDALNGNELAALRGHDNPVYSLDFSPDGTVLASVSTDDTVRLWNTATGEEESTLSGHGDAVLAVAFSLDGTRVVSASADRTLCLWDVATGDELAILRGHEHGIRDVAFSADGSRLVSTSDDGTIRIWHTEPYWVRYRKRQAIVAARPEAEGIVDALWLKSNDWKTVAVRLREDATLSAPLRRAALNLVLRRATEHP